VVCGVKDMSGNTGLDFKSAAGCIADNGCCVWVVNDWIENVGTGIANGMSDFKGLKPSNAVWGSL